MSDVSSNKTYRNKNTVWDIVFIVFQVFYQRIQFWGLFNLVYLLYSPLIITIPGAKAAMFRNLWEGLEETEALSTKDTKKMKTYLKEYFSKALLIFLIKLLLFLIITVSIWFWISREAIAMRFVSIISIYGLLLWSMMSLFLFPVMIENSTRDVKEIFTASFLLAFKNPFETLLFVLIDKMLLVIEFVLFGPLMFVFPALRAILSILCYWYLIEKEMPFVIISQSLLQKIILKNEVNDQ